VRLLVCTAGLRSRVVAQQVAGDDVALDEVELAEDRAFQLGLAGFEGTEALVEAFHSFVEAVHSFVEAVHSFVEVIDASAETVMAAKHESCECHADGEDGDHFGRHMEILAGWGLTVILERVTAGYLCKATDPDAVTIGWGLRQRSLRG